MFNVYEIGHVMSLLSRQVFYDVHPPGDNINMSDLSSWQLLNAVYSYSFSVSTFMSFIR